jgi:ADP-L-glycero-D-manno-heptose 6-epimerase
MKVLVTGYKGFIGSYISNYLTEQGHEVEGYDWVENVVPHVEGYDWVVHCGAISDTTERVVEKVWQHNYEFTLRLLQICDHFGTNIQIASTAAVYGNMTEFNESSAVYPQTPYAWSKFLVDKFLNDNGYDSFSMNVQTFRYFNVYGPGEGHKGDQMSLVSKFQKQASQDGVIKLFEDSDKYFRDCICVHDIAVIQEKLMHTDEAGLFNMGTNKAPSVEEVARTIAKKYDAKIEYIPMPDKLKSQYQEYTCADNAKLHNAVPIRHWMTVEEYINATD